MRKSGWYRVRRFGDWSFAYYSEVTEKWAFVGDYTFYNETQLGEDYHIIETPVNPEPETISDGHGNTWSKNCQCGGEMQIIRPGSVTCPNCEESANYSNPADR